MGKLAPFTFWRPAPLTACPEEEVGGSHGGSGAAGGLHAAPAPDAHASRRAATGGQPASSSSSRVMMTGRWPSGRKRGSSARVAAYSGVAAPRLISAVESNQVTASPS